MPIQIVETMPAGATKLFVVTGDVHIHSHAYANHLTERGMPNRIEQGIKVLRACWSTADDHDVPLLINGDLTHVKAALDPVVTTALVDFFNERQNIKDPRIHLVPGNHEKPEKFGKVSTLDAFAGSHVTVHKEPTLVEFNGYKTTLCPFLYQHKEALAALPPAHLFVGHFPTSGVNLGKHTLECGVKFEDFQPERYLALLFNDIHKKQPVGPNGYHLGAPMQNNFGEEGYECGWWLVGASAATIYLQFFPSSAPKFHYVDTPEEADQLRAAGHYARVRPQAVVKKIMAQQEAARLDFNMRDMDETLQNYVRFQVEHGKFPAADKDAILAAAKEVL